MSRSSQIGKTATTVMTDEDGVIKVCYYNTNVVTISPDKDVLLYHGGYKTKTTMVRMNQASLQYGLGYQVYQEANRWFVRYRGQVIPFDGNTLILEN